MHDKGMTGRLAEFIVHTAASDIEASIMEHAKLAFLDWLGVTMAGKDDPMVKKLIEYADLMGGNAHATLLGHGVKKSMAQAALINGAASHALDYDDTQMDFLGHPSAVLFPGTLSLSEFKGIRGADFLTAYLIGLKVGITVAACAGHEHYLSGFHGTSTMGALASASACARLLGLDTQQAACTLGIAATQAAGLKRVFGTMCKPFNAGRASEAGLTSALLAEKGFTSAQDILEGESGFFQALRGAVDEEALGTLGETWGIRRLAQKYHASCHATHSPIEAAWAICNQEGLSAEEIKTITVHNSEMGMSAAFRAEAATGLEGKFCIPYCVANALLQGEGETGLRAFTSERVNDPKVKAFMGRIKTEVDKSLPMMAARVVIVAADGNTYTAFSSILDEVPELSVKQEKLKDKFIDLCRPVLGKEKTKVLHKAVLHLDEMDDMKKLTDLVQG